jgi:tRNA(Arg) A34 adenosine deaminase TadA
MNLELMREAIRLSREPMLSGAGGPFGAVIARENRIVGRGWNQVTSTLDPTAHAEIVAIRDACRQLGDFSLAGCDIYASCEPCPLCLAAIWWARIDRIFFGAGCADAAAAGFDDSRFYRELALPSGERAVPIQQLLAEEARGSFQLWAAKPDRVDY